MSRATQRMSKHEADTLPFLGSKVGCLGFCGFTLLVLFKMEDWELKCRKGKT